ncbi:hypothetical protein [Rathayibacter sp. AY2B7]|uniref:P-loop NTPase n=1 Tax=Rathayibacter sp. AY2B7 TaxID=2080571 RepID=UPI0011AFFD3D|nr:hypothetical protein [Rathayibacter sp. AY2B7]
MTLQPALLRAVLSGEAILLTGAGFSRGLKDLDGDSLPTGFGLAKSIWPIAFGDEAFDDNSSLALIYEASLRASRKLLGEQLERHFRVDRSSIPKRYGSWFDFPWHKIYTLNVDDLDDAIASKPGHDRLQIISALTSTPGELRQGRTPIVHLNGRLDEFPKLTFTPAEFAGRTVRSDPWYAEFVSDLATRHVIVVGSVLDEPPLWHYLELRGSLGDKKELRPKSWLVSPSLDRARQAVLQRLNFDLELATEEQFFEKYLKPELPRLAEKVKALQNRPTVGMLDFQRVDELVRNAKTGNADYLLGRAPVWGDVVQGFAAEFESDADLTAAIDAVTHGVVTLHGSAGSGKTTSLMRAAAVLANRGDRVFWISADSEESFGNIRQAARKAEPDYLFIDDVDRFATDASNLIQGLLNENVGLVIVLGVSSHRFVQLDYEKLIPSDSVIELMQLTDQDAEHLIDELERGKRLGVLVNKTRDQKINAVTRSAQRQLLVTLIEATSGEDFHAKVARECDDLDPASMTVYGVICMAVTADSQGLSKQDILVAAYDFQPNEVLEALRHLEVSHLLTVTERSLYQARHRVIADSAVAHFRNEGLLSRWTVRIIFLLASKYDATSGRRSRYKKLLIRFLSHERLKKLLGDTAQVQRVYGDVEEWLSREFHYWLQRGSFETTYGDLPSAENFLNSARTLSPDDVWSETAWSLLLMKKALNAPGTTQATIWASEAESILLGILAETTRSTPHTMVVYLRYMLRWLQSAKLGVEEQRHLREDLLQQATIAKYKYASSPETVEVALKAQSWISTNAIFDPASEFM